MNDNCARCGCDLRWGSQKYTCDNKADCIRHLQRRLNDTDEELENLEKRFLDLENLVEQLSSSGSYDRDR